VGLLVAGEEGQSARLELHGGAEPALLQAIVEASARRSVEGTEVCVRFDAGGRRGWLVLLGLAPEVGAAYGAYREDVQHSLACSLDAESPRRRASGG
jgi:hypothetical protein